MNYEKLYKDALERMKSWVRGEHPECFCEAQKAAEFIFPELKESDEKVMEDIISLVNEFWERIGSINPEYSSRSRMIAWLEKQKSVDEEELKKGALKYVARQFMNWLDASIPEDEMCLSNVECKIIEDAFLKDDWARISHYMCEKLKRQGEQIELKKVEQGNHPRIVMADFNGGEGFFKLNLDNLNKEQVDAIEMMINNPKQGERRSLDADKVIDWLKTKVYDDSTYGMAMIEKFKKDFGL